jgi:hypothetical protein
MSKYIRQLSAPLALSAALLLGACGGSDDGADTSLASDTALASDLQLAGQGDTAQPQLNDVPAGGGTTKAPTTSRPRTSTSGGTTARPSTPTKTASGNTVSKGTAGGETMGTLPAGTTLSLASNERVCTNNRKVGDTFTARLSESVTAGGVTVPAGATAVVRITALQQSDQANQPVVMKFNVISLRYNNTSYPITAEVTSANVEQVRSSTKSSDAKKVIGGAVVGAIAGQILGKDTKSTVIGAATGAAAGTAVAMATGNYEGCIPVGGRIAIRLTESARVAAD